MMTGVIYTGTDTSGYGLGYNIAPGTTRWNTATNQMEMYDGQQWVAVSAGEVQTLTLSDIIQNAEDQVAVSIEEEYADNAAIQDAFDQWEEANKRFKVILALAENK